MSALAQSTYPVPENFMITPYASYTAIGFVVFFALFIIIARLAIRVDGQQSDLILFNKSPQKHLLLLVSKQLYNTTAAQNNIASAIANGLMEPPPNYDSNKSQTPVSINNSAKSNGHVSHHLSLTELSVKTNTTSLNSINKLEPSDSLDSIEPLNKNSSKRPKW